MLAPRSWAPAATQERLTQSSFGQVCWIRQLWATREGAAPKLLRTLQSAEAMTNVLGLDQVKHLLADVRRVIGHPFQRPGEQDHRHRLVHDVRVGAPAEEIAKRLHIQGIDLIVGVDHLSARDRRPRL